MLHLFLIARSGASIALILALLVISGCSALSPKVDEAEASRRFVAETARAFGPVTSAASKRIALVLRLRAAGLTPLAGSSFETGAAAPVVAGFVPGQHPTQRTTLVIVAQSLDSPALEGTLEAARQIVHLADTGNTPDLTVLFAFWSPSRGQEAGLDDVKAASLWPSVRRRSVAVIGPDGCLQTLTDDLSCDASAVPLAVQDIAPSLRAAVIQLAAAENASQ